VLRRASTIWAVVLLCASAPAAALAQDGEVAGDSGAGYAWGEGGGSTGGSAMEDPLRIMAYAGVGVGARLVRNIDPEFDHEFATPPYLDVGGALYLPGGDIRHGPAFFLSTNLTGEYNSGVQGLRQWSLTPGYQILIPLRRVIDGMDHDWLHLQGRLGIPITLSGVGDDVYVSPGLELAAAVHFKFLAGLGVYFEIQGNLYGGFGETVHPTISGDLGLLFDYEVLP
jgi:hypothetical protein